MKKTLWYIFGALFFSIPVWAQQLPPPPTPVIDREMRDPNSGTMRALELERLKREYYKLRPQKSYKEIAAKFSEIKDDFENIQKLQTAIVKTYTTGKTVDYEKIARLSAEISKKARHLEENLFYSNPEESPKTSNKDKTKSVRDLIIELDKAIGKFVMSPIFSNRKLVDTRVSEDSQLELEKIIRFSAELSFEAKRSSINSK